MGFMTLEDFRDSVRHVLGGRGVPLDRIDRWVNQGIATAAGNHQLKAKLATGIITTADGTESYVLPADALGVENARIEAENANIVGTSLNHLKRYEAENKSIPKAYATDDNFIYFRPVPDAIYTVDIYYWQIPTLTTALSTAPYPNQWDSVILQYIHFFVYGDMGRPNEAGIAYRTARAIANDLIKDTSYDLENAGFGVQVPRDLSDLVDQESL